MAWFTYLSVVRFNAATPRTSSVARLGFLYMTLTSFTLLTLLLRSVEHSILLSSVVSRRLRRPTLSGGYQMVQFLTTSLSLCSQAPSTPSLARRRDGLEVLKAARHNCSMLAETDLKLYRDKPYITKVGVWVSGG